MAVLKHTSPTAEPLAPSPCPATTVPSASTSRPVSGASAQALGVSRLTSISPPPLLGERRRLGQPRRRSGPNTFAVAPDAPGLIAHTHPSDSRPARSLQERSGRDPDGPDPSHRRLRRGAAHL